MSEYRAVINVMVSIHKLKGNELREVIPTNTMKESGVPLKKLVQFDGDSEHQILQKVREWLASAQ
jgi:hypothetical protein